MIIYSIVFLKVKFWYFCETSFSLTKNRTKDGHRIMKGQNKTLHFPFLPKGIFFLSFLIEKSLWPITFFCTIKLPPNPWGYDRTWKRKTKELNLNWKSTVKIELKQLIPSHPNLVRKILSIFWNPFYTQGPK